MTLDKMYSRYPGHEFKTTPSNLGRGNKSRKAMYGFLTNKSV
jgi:hypothetical protein